jgi:hypothetical protein
MVNKSYLEKQVYDKIELNCYYREQEEENIYQFRYDVRIVKIVIVIQNAEGNLFCN